MCVWGGGGVAGIIFIWKTAVWYSTINRTLLGLSFMTAVFCVNLHRLSGKEVESSSDQKSV